MAFGEAAAEQIRRIETAEADLSRAEEEFRHLEEKARQTAEQVVNRASEQRLAELEAIRVRAEAETERLAEAERQLNADIEALREAAAQQLKRIETANANLQTAEVDLHRAGEEFLQIENRVRETAEQAATRLAETEMRRQTAANEIAKAEADAQATANDVEQHLTELKAIRAQADAEANQRAEVERQLNAEIEVLREAEAKQFRQIDEAKGEVQRLSEGQTQLLQIFSEEEQRLVELESACAEFEAASQRRYEEEQRLMAKIEALKETESEQFSRIADAEAALQTIEVAVEAAVNPEQVELQIGPGADAEAECEIWPNGFQTEPPNPQTPTEWSMFELGDQSNEHTAEGLEFLSDDGIDLQLERTDSFTVEGATEDLASATDSVVVNEDARMENHETLRFNSLTERLSSGEEEYASVLEELGRLDGNAVFDLITDLFDDSSEEVRNAAARALFDLSNERSEFFTRALREASPERTRQIVTALEASGLADEAIDSLAGESREKTHDAFSMLFLMAQAGEVQSLLQTIEKHPNINVRLSVIKLLTFTNRPDIIPALRSLAVRGALPIEVRSALMKSIYEMSSGHRERSLSAA